MRQTIAILGAALLLPALFAGAPAAAELQGSYWYSVDHITKVDEDGRIVLWAVLPPERPEQKVTITAIEPEPVAIIDDPHTGARIVEWLAVPTEGFEPTASFFHFDFRFEELPVAYEIDAADVKPYDKSSPDYVKFTASEIWLQTDGIILDQAREIVGDETNPWKQANLVFDWVMHNLAFVPGGSGERDARSVLIGRAGDCSQFSCLFTALCRSVGIPARNVTNVWTGGGAHVSAEIYLQDIGWVPMDTSLGQMLLPGGGGLTPAEVRAFMNDKEIPPGDPRWLAGHLYSNRLITSVGNNLRFESPTLGHAVEFQQMNPAGASAIPEAIEIRGLNRDVIHGGFWVFGRTVDGEEEAHRLTHQHLASSYFREGLYDVVEDACRKASLESGDEILSWINEGKMWMHKGEYYKAEAAFKRAQTSVARSRRDKAEALVWTHNYLGNCYDLLGKRRMAEEEYQAVLDLGVDYRGALDYAKRYLKKPFAEQAPAER